MSAFGADKSNLDLLVQQKTVTISRLLEICPTGTLDPTPFVFDNTLYVMMGFQGIALLSNFALRPVDPKLIVPDEDTTPASRPVDAAGASKTE